VFLTFGGSKKVAPDTNNLSLKVFIELWRKN
jgi:hypothetical protein